MNKNALFKNFKIKLCVKIYNIVEMNKTKYKSTKKNM